MMKSIDNRQHNLIVEINNELLHDFFLSMLQVERWNFFLIRQTNSIVFFFSFFENFSTQ